jgi:hypothetical protein
MNRYLNDGTTDAPKLRLFLNTDCLLHLPADSSWPGLTGDAALERIRQDGFAGVQTGGFIDWRNPSILPHCGMDRINRPDEADAVLRRHRERGDLCVTLHVGWGMESDDDSDALVRAILAASEKHALPAFVETHRATITQDMWRTVQLTRRVPDVRFNGDFSHYYCGQEMVYGDFEAKLDFLQPIFDRIGFLHGRIASPGSMQAPIESADTRPVQAVGDADYLAHFKQMWRRAMEGFRTHAGRGDVLIFAPEVLTPKFYYARLVDRGGMRTEEADRYAQALLCRDIARDLYGRVA